MFLLSFVFPGTTPTVEQRQPIQTVDKEHLFDRQASQADTARPFLHALAESRVQDIQVKTFLCYVERYCRAHYLISPIEFPQDHPVEEVGRWEIIQQLTHWPVRNVEVIL